MAEDLESTSKVNYADGAIKAIPQTMSENADNTASPIVIAESNLILEGVFAISKPCTTTTPQLLLDLQTIFATCTTFAPLLHHTRQERLSQAAHQPPGQKLKDEEATGRFFKLGHGGTLDPLASGVLIVGIGRGTKHLSTYLDSCKTYETVVLFGVATTTYDVQGDEVARAGTLHLTEEMVREKLERDFLGKIHQVPPVYSGLKVGGVKAVEYARAGVELPRELEAREVCVYECEMVELLRPGEHEFRLRCSGRQEQEQGQEQGLLLPAAKIRLTVSSGFYVRSFAHDLGRACGTVATMASLHRSQQANFYASSSPTPLANPLSSSPSPPSPPPTPAIPYTLFTSSPESTWSPQLTSTLTAWMAMHPPRDPSARGPGRKARNKDVRKQRFRGEWLAETKKERIAQQGGKTKGKASRRRQEGEKGGRKGREQGEEKKKNK